MNSRLLFVVGLCFFWGANFFAAGAEIPQLTVTNQTTNMVISWPGAAQWVLEESSNLQTAVPWTLVSQDLYQSNASSRFVSVVTNVGSRFFRLRKTGLSVPGLNGYWGLDEGAGQISEDGSTFGSALLFTNASWGAGRIGPGALRFTGSPAGPNASRAWVSNNNTVLPPLGNPFSLSLWLNPDALPIGWSGIAGNNSNGTNGWHIALNNAGPGTNFFVFTSAGLSTSLSITGRFLLLPGQWHQLTVTHDGTEGSIYLDSALLARGSGPLATHNGPIYFGGGIANFDSFLGRIDDLRLYTNSLPHEQVSLTGCWHFDETNGQTCMDSSIQGHSAILSDSSARVSGHGDLGIDLSKSQVTIGNQDYAILPPNGGSFSISFWLLPTAINPGWSGLMKLGEGPLGGFELTFTTDDSGKPSFHFASTNVGGTLDLLSPVPLTTGNWTKFDLTFNGGIATLYANGKQLKSINGAIRGTKSPLLLGTVPTLPPFNGVIDDLKIYSRERGASEIGPIANTMWETVMLNSSTNMQLQGDGPIGKPLTYTIVPILTPTNGSVSLQGSSFIYTAASRKGPDAFTYTVSDGEFTSDPAIVTMSVVQPHYLSPTGGYVGPQDGSSPMQAWVAGPPDAMDAILKTNKFYDCFFYAPGEYQTRGAKVYERSTANPGCKHIGSGSVGPTLTRIRLVDIWSAWEEETIFGAANANVSSSDGFEVQRMVLDCNSTNVPKYAKGEPIWLRIPLTNTTHVDTVTIRWANAGFYGYTYWQIGRASEFSVEARFQIDDAWFTNTLHSSSTGQVDVVDVGLETDEILLRLEQRAPGVDFYGINEIQISGGTVSLPQATSTNGFKSQLSPMYSAVFMADNTPETAWASGPEEEVLLSLPLPHLSLINQITLQWNCKNLAGTGRLGPAATYSIRARDETTGQYTDVPFNSQGRSADGREVCILGTLQAPIAISTDHLIIHLTSKESGINFYSLNEIKIQNGNLPISIKAPIAFNSFIFGNREISKAFDSDVSTHWASGIQGMVGAVNVIGSNMKFIDLSIVGFGTKAGRECFPVYLGAQQTSGQKHIGNVLVERCSLSQPALENHDGVTGITLAAIPPNTLSNAVVQNCEVNGLKPHFAYSQGMTAVHVENCSIYDCEKGIYFEPYYGRDNIGPVMIRSNFLDNVSYGVYLLMYPGTHFGPLNCIGNEMVMNGSGGWALASCDTCFGGPSGSIESLTAIHNIMRFRGWTQEASERSGGIAYNNIQHAVVGNNILALDPEDALRIRAYPSGSIFSSVPKEDCDHPGPFPPAEVSYPPALDLLPTGYQRNWFNNRNLSGTNLSVRFLNLGTDGPASQQQWLE